MMSNYDKLIFYLHEYLKETTKESSFQKGMDFIPVSGATIEPDDVEELVLTALNKWYTEGKRCAAFRRSMSKRIQKKKILLTNSGSSANLLAISALAEKYGKRKYVITSATGFATTVAPIYQNNLIPIYVDCDPSTLCPSIPQIQEALTTYGDEISGIIISHPLGFLFDERRIAGMLQEDQFLIADCCDAFGSMLTYPDLPPVHSGFFSHASTFSFFPAHHITTAEGGAVATDDVDLYTIITSLANWGRDCHCAPGQNNVCGKRFDWEWEGLPKGWDHKYTYTRMGYNLKMTEFQGALGLTQIAKLDHFTQRRKENYAYLLAGLSRYSEYLDFIDIPGFSDPSPFGFTVLVKEAYTNLVRDLILYLESYKIATRRVFSGNVIKQPGYQNLEYKTIGPLTGSDRIMNNGFWVGCWPGLNQDQLSYMIEVFGEFFQNSQ